MEALLSRLRGEHKLNTIGDDLRIKDHHIASLTSKVNTLAYENQELRVIRDSDAQEMQYLEQQLHAFNAKVHSAMLERD